MSLGDSPFLMFRFFQRDEAFFDLLEASAAQARHCAIQLKDVVAHLGGDTSAQLAYVQETRRKHKRLTKGITERLCRTFMTPLDREDIETLNGALSKIPKTVEKIAERLVVCPVKFTNDIVLKQCVLLDQATAEVVGLVSALREKPRLEEIQDRQGRLQHIEGHGDKLLVDLLSELYHDNVEAIEVIILKDVYELLERAIDRCRDAGNAVFQAVLKYS